MKIKKILKLFRKASLKNKWDFPCAMFIFDDGSGRIVKDFNKYVYLSENTYLSFANIDELVSKLKKEAGNEDGKSI
jgi:hypothetical protein